MRSMRRRELTRLSRSTVQRLPHRLPFHRVPPGPWPISLPSRGYVNLVGGGNLSRTVGSIPLSLIAERNIGAQVDQYSPARRVRAV